MDSERFSRNISLIGEDNQQKLADSCVMLVGVGGVGGYAGETLVRAGIGKIIIVDKDTVDITNLNRQIIATEKTIGQKKTDVFESRAKSINPNIEIVKYEIFLDGNNTEEIFKEKVDFVVDCIDTMSAKTEIWRYCQQNDIPYISSLGMAKRINPQKVRITTLDKTENDPMAKALRQISRKKELSLKVPVVFSDESPMNNDVLLGSMMPVCATAGIMCGYYVISKILHLE